MEMITGGETEAHFHSSRFLMDMSGYKSMTKSILGELFRKMDFKSCSAKAANVNPIGCIDLKTAVHLG